MKTPLPFHEELLPALLATGWGVEVAIRPLFLPIGDSAYSYRVQAVSGERSYLKVAHLRSGLDLETAIAAAGGRVSW